MLSPANILPNPDSSPLFVSDDIAILSDIHGIPPDWGIISYPTCSKYASTAGTVVPTNLNFTSCHSILSTYIFHMNLVQLRIVLS